jgi:hypothetical protein
MVGFRQISDRYGRPLYWYQFLVLSASYLRASLLFFKVNACMLCVGAVLFFEDFWENMQDFHGWINRSMAFKLLFEYVCLRPPSRILREGDKNCKLGIDTSRRFAVRLKGYIRSKCVE